MYFCSDSIHPTQKQLVWKYRREGEKTNPQIAQGGHQFVHSRDTICLKYFVSNTHCDLYQWWITDGRQVTFAMPVTAAVTL